MGMTMVTTTRTTTRTTTITEQTLMQIDPPRQRQATHARSQ